MRTAAVIAATLALASATAAQAKDGACIPPAEAEALATVLLPDAVEAVAKRCEATLPAGATLRSGLPPIVTRWRSEGASRTAAAGAAVVKLIGVDMKGGDPGAAVSIMRTMLINQLVGSVRLDSCTSIDRAVTLVAPLPAPNIAGIAILLVQLQGSAKKADDLPICKAPSQ